MEEKFNSIVELTDEFSRQHLNEEYAQLIRQATAALSRFPQLTFNASPKNLSEC